MDATLALERSATGAAGRCVWNLPRLESSIQLSLDVVERIEREALAAFRAVAERGSEIGGLLLGRWSEEPRVCSIEDCEPIPCDYSRGPLYQLSDQDEERLRAALARPRDGVSVVGFFRSHTRKEIALDENDVALADAHFPGQQAVFLLVKPFSMKPPRGAFFLRAGRELALKPPALECTFRRSELEKTPERPAGPTAPLGPTTPAVSRDAWVVAGLQALASSAAASEPIAPVVIRTVEPAAPAAEVAAAPVAAVAKTEPLKPAEVAAAPVVVANAEPAKRVEIAVAAMAARPGAQPRWRVWPWFIAIVLAAVAGGAALYFRPGPLDSIISPLARDEGALALRVERLGGQIRLSWNQTAPAVAHAQKAMLSILDGDQRQELELDLGQLRTGSLAYSPTTPDVTFRLEVSDVAHGKSWTESVRAVTGRPSPMGLPAYRAPTPAAAPAPAMQPSPQDEEPAQAAPAAQPAPPATEERP